MLSYLIFGITFAFAAAVQPGPLQTYIFSQTLKRGCRATLPAAFAPVISDIPIITLILFLLNAMPSGFIVVLRFVGGLFLLYLGYMAFRSWQNFNTEQSLSKTSVQQTLVNTVIINFLNPGPYLGWSLIMGPLFLEGWKKAPVNGVVLIISFYTTMVLTLMGIIYLFSFARHLGSRVSKSLVGISAIVLFGFGLYQLWMGINTIF